jgi:hypothetical protein
VWITTVDGKLFHYSAGDLEHVEPAAPLSIYAFGGDCA